MKTLATDLNQKQADGFYELTHGIDIDRFLFREELQVQKAWVEGLSDIGVLSEHERNLISQVLLAIELEMETDSFDWVKTDEDIHMNIERIVTTRLGDLGKKMHLGRSRNDLIATTLKLYLANRCMELSKEVSGVANGIIDLAERDIEVVLPAYTHTQAAQPVRMAHIWNFHALNLASDARRFKKCCGNLFRVMPLGSAAVAGTHLNINLFKVATSLGFKTPPINSIHGVSDRDDVIEVAQSITMLGLHLTRFCEEIIFLSSSPIRVVRLPAEWSSGSSIMPNKRNPDFFEIVRAKAKKLIGLGPELMSMSTGLTSGYASDFHEQKRAIVLAIRDLQKMLPILKLAFSSVLIDENRATELLMHGHILATDLANLMVFRGATFRDAYREVAANIVALEGTNEQVGLNQISFESAVETRDNYGGTSRTRVLETMALIRTEINNL